MVLVRAKVFDNVTYLLVVLAFTSSVSLMFSVLMLPGIDKSSIDSAFYVLSRLPPIYWVGVCTLVSTLLLDLSRRHTSLITILLTVLSVAYMEMPRLMYGNGFQIEYFHQAQVYHVLNYGRVTDPKYPFPVADVAHAILSAIFIDVTDLKADYVVGHLLPILLRLALAISVLCITARFRMSKYYLYFLVIAPLYVIISDTEPSFTNHYVFVLPLYSILVYLLIRLDYEEQFESYILLMIVTSSIIYSHIYFATLATISLLTFLLLNNVIRKGARLYAACTLVPIISFLMWHGYMCEWSIEKFYAEINFALLPAIDRFLAFKVNPLAYFFKAKERYGSIPIKDGYQNLLMLKNLIVLAINVIVISAIVYTLLYALREGRFREIALSFLTKRVTYLWGFSGLFLAIYGLTGTTHPQRVLEAFIIPNCGLALLLLRPLLEKDLKILERWRAKKGVALIVLTLALMSVSFIPLKIITHWGTSLTYIGFSQKYIHKAMFLSEYGNYELSVHHVGPTPHWFLTEIIGKWPGSRIYSLDGREGETYFTETLTNIERSLNMQVPHYVYYSLSSLFAMRAKYAMEPLLESFVKGYEELTSRTNVIYMNSIIESICYVR